MIFDPDSGTFDEVSWLSPYVRRLGALSVGVTAGVLVAVFAGGWTAVLPLIGVPLATVVAARSEWGRHGAGPVGLDAGRFAIPWGRIASVDDKGFVNLDPPAGMPKTVSVSGRLRKVRLETRGWQDRELGRAVENWAPRLLRRRP